MVGVDSRAQIALARHAPTGVTLKNYQDFRLLDLWAEIRKLPPIRWDESKAEVLAATGSCDIRPQSVARPVAQNIGRKGGKTSKRVQTPNGSDRGRHFEKTLENKAKKTPFEVKRALEPTGVEPATSWLQTTRQQDPKPISADSNPDFNGPSGVRCTPGCTECANVSSDPDLAVVVTAWASLPEAVQSRIVGLVEGAINRS
jgi:hypothetical protein